MSDANEAGDALRGSVKRVTNALAANEARNRALGMLYRALKKTGRLQPEAVLGEYRCAQNCLLLQIFTTPGGPAYYRPNYRANPTESTRQRAVQSSTLSGPEKESVEGAPDGRGQFGYEERPNHWPARWGYLASLQGTAIRCEHGSSVIDNEIPFGKIGKPIREIFEWPGV